MTEERQKSGAEQVDMDKMVKNHSRTVLQQHPLMIEDVLDKIFPYFDDAKNLTSFRLVNKTWKKSASRTAKKALRWKIGPGLYSEKAFMDVMSKCTDDIFYNFLWTHGEKTPNMNSTTGGEGESTRVRRSERRKHLNEEWHKFVQPFLEKFGPLMVNLELRARDPTYVKPRLQSTFMPNLEHLELYDLSVATLTDRESFNEIKSFPKLKSVRFNPKVFHSGREVRSFEEGQAIICEKILEGALQLRELELNLTKTSQRLLKREGAFTLTTLASLTTFITSVVEPEDARDPIGSPPVIVALSKIELRNLLKLCPNLKVLCTSVNHLVKEKDICEVLAKSKVCTQLEELHLTIADDPDRYEFDDSDDSLSSLSESEALAPLSSSLTVSSDEDTNLMANMFAGEGLHLDGLANRHLAKYSVPRKKRPTLKISGLAGVKRSADRKEAIESVEAGPSASKLIRHEPTVHNATTSSAYNSREPPKSPKPYYPSLPPMPKLKKLGLHNWKLSNNLDIFDGKPLLREIDLYLQGYFPVRLGQPVMPTLTENLNVKYLKCRDCDHQLLSPNGISTLAELFPNLEEFDVKIDDDDTLRTICARMRQLKRLNLNDSRVTDEGITGLTFKRLKQAFGNRWKLEVVAKWRKDPFIGDLTDLQQFTYTGQRLTKFSVHYGIAALKNLTNLKLMAWREQYWRKKLVSQLKILARKSGDRPSVSSTANSSSLIVVDIRPILENCKYLVKLDVNGGHESDSDDDDPDFTDNSDVEDEKPKPEFKGCGLKPDQIELVKKEFPYLELVYGEKLPLKHS